MNKNDMPPTDTIIDIDRQKIRYRLFAKLLLFFSIIYTLVIVILITGTYYLSWGIRPAGLTLDRWILSNITLHAIFIAFEVLFLFLYFFKIWKRKEAEKPQPLYVKGKQILIYTLPIGAKGGIFSKTYITINEDTVLNLRYQMILPNDLWGKKG